MPMRSLTADRNSLLAAKAFGRLYRNVPQEKLHMLQLASRCVAEPSTGPRGGLFRFRVHTRELAGAIKVGTVSAQRALEVLCGGEKCRLSFALFAL